MAANQENADSPHDPRWGFPAAVAALGIRLFNQHRYFEAHEALEVVWLREHGERKALLHGLIQIAAAFHHYSRANLLGFRSLMLKGSQKLERCAGETYADFGINWAQLEKELNAWRRYIAADEHDPMIAPPPLPRIISEA